VRSHATTLDTQTCVCACKICAHAYVHGSMQTYSPTSYTPTRTPQMHVCLRIRTCKCARTHARILACKILLNLQFAKLSHNSRFCALFSFHPMTSAPSLNQSLIPGVPHIFARTHLCVRVASTVKIIPRACHHTGPAATHMHMSVARFGRFARPTVFAD
jgi:hypothetical protein